MKYRFLVKQNCKDNHFISVSVFWASVGFPCPYYVSDTSYRGSHQIFCLCGPGHRVPLPCAGHVSPHTGFRLKTLQFYSRSMAHLEVIGDSVVLQFITYRVYIAAYVRLMACKIVTT